MHFKSSMFVAAATACLLSSVGVSAGPVLGRAESTSTSTSSQLTSSTTTSATATTKPAAITSAALTTTIDPATLVASTATIDPPATGTDSQALPTGSSLIVCKNPKAESRPFCLPENNTIVYPGETYYVSWDTAFFNSTSSATIILDYVNNTDGGQQAYESKPDFISVGYVAIKMNTDMLRDGAVTNLTVTLMEMLAAPLREVHVYRGPHLVLMNKPAKHYQPSPDSHISNHGLIIGVPVALGCCLLIVLGLFFGFRKTRKFGPFTVKKKGYSGRRTRTKNMKSGAIRLDEREQSVPMFRDEPTHVNVGMARSVNGVMHSRDVSLGSLVSAPTNDHRHSYR